MFRKWFHLILFVKDHEGYKMRTLIGIALLGGLFLLVFFAGLKAPVYAKGSGESVAAPAVAPKPLLGKKIVFVIAPDKFRDEELFETKERLEKMGAKTRVVSTTTKTINGMLGEKVKPDGLLGSVNPDSFDAIVFVGGVGVTALWDNEEAQALAKKFYNKKKIVAAICLAPVILANAGLLDGVKATVFRSAKKKLMAKGAEYVNKKVVRSGRIITANGPSAIPEFVAKIREALMENAKSKSPGTVAPATPMK